MDGSTRAHGRRPWPGAPASEERIFEPFYRPPVRPKPTVAWAWASALVKSIAARHGGDVRYVARDGGGSEFEVNLAKG